MAEYVGERVTDREWPLWLFAAYCLCDKEPWNGIERGGRVHVRARGEKGRTRRESGSASSHGQGLAHVHMHGLSWSPHHPYAHSRSRPHTPAHPPAPPALRGPNSCADTSQARSGWCSTGPTDRWRWVHLRSLLSWLVTAELCYCERVYALWQSLILYVPCCLCPFITCF